MLCCYKIGYFIEIVGAVNYLLYKLCHASDLFSRFNFALISDLSHGLTAITRCIVSFCSQRRPIVYVNNTRRKGYTLGQHYQAFVKLLQIASFVCLPPPLRYSLFNNTSVRVCVQIHTHCIAWIINMWTCLSIHIFKYFFIITK